MATTARKTAVRCLLRCEGGGYSNLVLRQELAQSGLTRQDRAFCTALVCGTLSRLRTLDFLLAPFLRRGVAALDAEVRAILRMGLYQLKWMDGVPARAAVNESAELCRAFKKSSAAGLVNAVLRRLADADAEAALAAVSDERERFALRYSLCDGLAAALYEEFGVEAAAVAAALFAPAPVYARANTRKTSAAALRDDLRQQNIEAEETGLANCLLLKTGFSGSCAPLEDGRMRIQSLPAQCAAAAVGAQPGEAVLDLCAAPGGKALCMAQDMANSGRVVAVDVNAARLALVEKQAAREGADIVETVCADAACYDTPQRFDRVLCDVPCSGYGELAAKPELRYREPAGAAELPALQYAILENGAKLLKPGGRLVYSTCTLLRRENEDIAARFLREHPAFEPAPAGVGEAFARVRGHEARFVPCGERNEGFYIASFRKMW